MQGKTVAGSVRGYPKDLMSPGEDSSSDKDNLWPHCFHPTNSPSELSRSLGNISTTCSLLIRQYTFLLKKKTTTF